ncbi:MAG TPA: hypothetical protein VF498_19130, partial [Anaerolineales bacterium]
MNKSDQAAVRGRVEPAQTVQPRLREPAEQAPDSTPPVQVMLAYDDDAGLETVLQVYRAILQRLAGRFEFQDSCWRFGTLTNPAQLERAA